MRHENFTRTKTASVLPQGLEDVALVDAGVSAAAGGMSLSWWHYKVASGEAPQPVIRAPRCTRWKLADVRRFWAEFAEGASTEAADRVLAQAKKATTAAQAKRRHRGQLAGA